MDKKEKETEFTYTPKIEVRVGKPVLTMTYIPSDRMETPEERAMRMITTVMEYNLQDAFGEKFPGKHAVWHGVPTKQYKKWRKELENYKMENEK